MSDDDEPKRRRKAMTPENVRLCQETALRLLHPARDADPRSADPRYQEVLDLEDDMILALCRLGFTASEVVGYLSGRP